MQHNKLGIGENRQFEHNSMFNRQRMMEEIRGYDSPSAEALFYRNLYFDERDRNRLLENSREQKEIEVKQLERLQNERKLYEEDIMRRSKF